jgi:hypothetical protein
MIRLDLRACFCFVMARWKHPPLRKGEQFSRQFAFESITSWARRYAGLQVVPRVRTMSAVDLLSNGRDVAEAGFEIVGAGDGINACNVNGLWEQTPEIKVGARQPAADSGWR